MSHPAIVVRERARAPLGHGDAGHLTANLVFGTVFGLLAAQALGSGLACLAILLAGGLGNGMNALVQGPGHASLGASTAVFAALGILVAHALRYRGALPGGVLRRYSPLVGGVLLLAYTGTGGERTDVVAHLTGFLAGLGTGWFARHIPERWLRRFGLLAAAVPELAPRFAGVERPVGEAVAAFLAERCR